MNYNLTDFLPLFLSVAVAYFASSILLRNQPLLRLALSSLMVVSAATIAVGVSIQVEQPLHREITLVFLVATVLILAILNFRDLQLSFLASSLGQSGTVFGLLVFFEFLVRELRLASVAFGDIFTLIGISEIFKQAAGVEPLGTSLALKRGVGFPSLQALAPLQELSHSVMFLSFVGWCLLGLHLFIKLIGNQGPLYVAASFILFLGVSFSTEAILRNSLFMSSHLLTALALGLLIAIFIERNGTWQASLVATIAISSAIFMRADNALIMMLPVTAIILGETVRDRIQKAWLFGVSYLSLPFWLWSFEVDISTLVTLGSIVFAIGGAAIVYLLPENYQWDVYSYFRNRMIAILIGAVLLSLLTSVSLNSFEALYQNYVMTEGLWGYSVLIFGALAIFLGFQKRKVHSIQNDVLALAIGFLGLMIFAKFGDGVFFAGQLEFARIGWGDSINRLLIYVFAPVSAVVFARVFDPEAKYDTLNPKPLTETNLK